MSYVTDYKSAPFALFNQNTANTNYSGTATPVYNGYTGTGLNGIPDNGLDNLLGSKWQTQDGRTLTLVSSAGSTNSSTTGVALVSGVLVQSAAEVTAHQKLAMTVPTAYPATAGTYQILVTNGATVINANQYEQGYAVVASGTGIGQILQIASHPGAAASATCVITLIDPIQVTLDATSKISLIYNPAANVVISPATTATGGPVGVTLYPVPAATASTFNATSGVLTTAGTPVYAFVVSHGPAACLIDNTITNVGYPVGVSKTTAGALGVATLTTVPQIGVSIQTLTSANAGMVTLFL